MPIRFGIFAVVGTAFAMVTVIFPDLRSSAVPSSGSWAKTFPAACAVLSFSTTLTLFLKPLSLAVERTWSAVIPVKSGTADLPVAIRTVMAWSGAVA